MSDQKAMNRETWAALQEAGFPGGPLEVETWFFAPDQPSAEALADDLRPLGWEPLVDSTRSGLLRRRTTWSVVATRTLEVSGTDELDAMVDQVEPLAEARGVEFDGWGALA